jgi:hypothetical protein
VLQITICRCAYGFSVPASVPQFTSPTSSTYFPQLQSYYFKAVENAIEILMRAH